MTDVLLHCPSCGGEAALSQRASQFGQRQPSFRVACRSRFTSCPMNSRTHHSSTEDRAISAWNTRTDISQARIAQLEARNGKLGDVVAYATQKFTHQEVRIAQLEAELEGWQDQFKAQFPDAIAALKANEVKK